MKIYKFIVAVLIWGNILSCKQPKVSEIVGHWHLFFDESNEKEIVEDLPTIDFFYDSTAILGKNIGKYGGIHGTYFFDERSIYFGGECIFIEFNFLLEENQLILNQVKNQNEILRSYKGIKCDKECCDLQKEFFYGLNVNIDLPQKNQNCQIFTDYTITSKIYFGIPLNKKDYGNQPRLILNNTFSDLNDLEQWLEIEKLKNMNFNKIAIFADKNTNQIETENVINSIQVNNKVNIFKAYRKLDNNNSFIICYEQLK